MTEYLGAFAVLVLAVSTVVVVHVASQLVGLSTEPVRAAPFTGGVLPEEHPLSRYHARWYAMTLVFLAFDLEMLFMYPWAVVLATVGTSALVEMFVFLGLLLVGVLYAWREGAFRWA